MRWNKALRYEPRSGARMQPTARAVGRSGKQTSPSGAKDQFSRTHFTAAPYILESQQQLSAAEDSRSPIIFFLRPHLDAIDLSSKKEIIPDRLKETPRFIFS
jgi:hypothetical protein